MGAVMGTQLTEEQRLERAIFKAMSSKKFCLLSALLMVGKIEVVDDHPTAYTDGVNIKFGREFIKSLNDKQLMFVLLHELMHMAYRHTFVWRDLYMKDAQVANMACDFVINLLIVEMDPHHQECEFPTDEDGELIGCYDEKYKGMDAKQVFKAIYEENGLEDNPNWPVVPSDGEGGDPTQGGNIPNNIRKMLKKQFDEHGWDEAKSLSEAEQEEIKDRIDQALRQGAQLAGKINGDIPRGIEELFEAKVKWEDVLRDFIKVTIKGHDDSTFKRFHKRFIGNDIFLPSTISRKVGKVLVGCDTSGSIDDTLLGRWLGELMYIAEEVEPSGIILLYWDTQVAQVETYGPEDYAALPQSTKPAGYGGTDPACVPVWMANGDNADLMDGVEAVVMLTDGYFYDGDGGALFEQLGLPVLWCVVGNKSFKPTYGVVVNVDGE